VWLEQATFAWRDADRHRLVCIWRIALDNEFVSDPRIGEARRETAQFGLICNMQRDGVGAIGERSFCGVASGVN